VKVLQSDTAPLGEGTLLQRRSGVTCVVEGFILDFKAYLHIHAFIHEWNEPQLPLPSQAEAGSHLPRPRRDGRLSWPRHHDGE